MRWPTAGRSRNISPWSATAIANSSNRPSVAEKSGLRLPSLNASPPAIRMMSGASTVMRLAGPRRVREGDDEAQQIEAERKHPEHRHGDDVGGEVGRRRQHQPRGHGGERDPVQRSCRRSAAARSPRAAPPRPAPARSARRPRPAGPGTRRGRSTASSAAAGPSAARRSADRRSGRRSCRDWRRRRADKDRRGCVSSAYQRCISGACAETMKKSGPIELIRNQGTQKAGSPSAGGKTPVSPIGSHSAARPSRTMWMPTWRRGREPREPVRIGVAGEQQQLIDQHRAVPHRRRAADPRQRHARDHRLGQEQQERAGDDGQNEERPRITLVHPPHGGAGAGVAGAVALAVCTFFSAISRPAAAPRPAHDR